MGSATIRSTAAFFIALTMLAAATRAADPPARPAKAQAAEAGDDPFGDVTAAKPAKTAASASKAAEKSHSPLPLSESEMINLGLPLSPAEKKIEEALREPATIEFVETPVKDVVDYLKDVHRIEIQLDAPALKEAGINEDSPLTKNIKGIPLAAALKVLLGDQGMAWDVRDDILWVTTPKSVQAHRVTKLYSVGDLIGAGNAPGQSGDNYAPLIEMITATVAPATWDAKSGACLKGATLGGAKLISVSASYPVHRELAQFLANARRLATSAKAPH